MAMALLVAPVGAADLEAASSRQGAAATSPWAPRGRGRACCGRRMRRVLSYLPSDGAGLRSQVANGVATATRAFASLHSDLKAQLSDPDLLKHQSYVDGRWIDSQSGQTIEVGPTSPPPPPPPPPRVLNESAQASLATLPASLPALLLVNAAALAGPNRCWTRPPASRLRGCPTAAARRRGRPLPPLRSSSRSGGSGRARSAPPSCAGGSGLLAAGIGCLFMEAESWPFVQLQPAVPCALRVLLPCGASAHGIPVPDVQHGASRCCAARDPACFAPVRLTRAGGLTWWWRRGRTSAA